MRQVNIDQKTAAFNKARVENQKKIFTGEELYAVLKKAGIPRDIADKLNKYNYFEKEVIDGKTTYAFKVNPLHRDAMESFYKEKRKAKKEWLESKKNPASKVSTKKEATETEIILSLKAMGGYRVLKDSGIDTDRIKREDPELYKELRRRFTKWIVV